VGIIGGIMDSGLVQQLKCAGGLTDVQIYDRMAFLEDVFGEETEKCRLKAQELREFPGRNGGEE